MASYEHMDSVEIVVAHLLSGDNVTVIADWAHARIVEEIDPFDNDKRFPALNVQGKDDVLRASLGDYVVKHENGSFSVHQTLAFQKDYRKVGS